MRLIVIESPFRGATPEEQDRNVRYARAAVRDSLLRGEAPIASHLLHTQEGILRDGVPQERALGMAAGHAWIEAADQVAVYADLGESPGMKLGIDEALRLGVPVERRTIPGWEARLSSQS
jgi:hypothetical protein